MINDQTLVDGNILVELSLLRGGKTFQVNIELKAKAETLSETGTKLQQLIYEALRAALIEAKVANAKGPMAKLTDAVMEKINGN